MGKSTQELLRTTGSMQGIAVVVDEIANRDLDEVMTSLDVYGTREWMSQGLPNLLTTIGLLWREERLATVSNIARLLQVGPKPAEYYVKIAANLMGVVDPITEFVHPYNESSAKLEGRTVFVRGWHIASLVPVYTVNEAGEGYLQERRALAEAGNNSDLT